MPIFLIAFSNSDLEIALDPSISIIWKAFLIERFDCLIALNSLQMDYYSFDLVNAPPLFNFLTNSLYPNDPLPSRSN